MSRPSLLIAEPPLQVLPSLAKAIGLNEAIVLQQIQYWIALEQGIEKDGRRWIYNTVEEWRKQFPFWSTDTIQRTLQSLRDKGLVDAQKLSSDKWKHTLYYSINYNNLQDCITASCGKGLRENAESITADCNSGITADCDIPLPQVAVIIPTENTQRVPTETSSENTSFVAQSAPSENPVVTDGNPVATDSAQSETQVVAKASASRMGTRIPRDFTPSDKMREIALSQFPGVDLLIETDKFCDYWQAQAGSKARKADWQLTWKTWIRTAYERLEKPRTGQYTQHYQKPPTQRERVAALEVQTVHRLQNDTRDPLAMMEARERAKAERTNPVRVRITP
jgi:hypothetical protein